MDRLTLYAVGKGNRHCLCESCEKSGRGAYRVDPYTDSDHSSESDVSEASDKERVGTLQQVQVLGAVNERRTRRGVYTTLPTPESDSETSDSEASNTTDGDASLRKLGSKKDIEEENVMQVVAEAERAISALTPISQSPASSALDRVGSPVSEESSVMSLKCCGRLRLRLTSQL